MSYAHNPVDRNLIRDVEVEWKNKGLKVLEYCKDFDTVVQAGGNLGIFPIELSKHFKRVITFEPVLETYGYLRQNIKGITNIVPFNSGLGREWSNASITKTYPGNSGATVVSPTKDGELRIVSLDTLEYHTLDLLWLDIEGGEWEALLGAEETINRCKPVIVLENKGLIPGFGGDLNGSPNLVEAMEGRFNYVKVARMMRDDIFVYGG